MAFDTWFEVTAPLNTSASNWHWQVELPEGKPGDVFRLKHISLPDSVIFQHFEFQPPGSNLLKVEKEMMAVHNTGISPGSSLRVVCKCRPGASTDSDPCRAIFEKVSGAH